jgi:pilus assembly protein CpaD
VNSFKSLLATALLAAASSGCTPYTKASWTPVEAPVENQVRWTESSHVVRFAPGESDLSAGERGRLEAFLSLARPDYTDRVFVLGEDGGLDSRRVASVREYLVERRLANRQIMSGAAADDGPNALTVVIGRYVVIPPSCPNWSKPSTGDSNNRTGSNFGCATATNLGAMVADPGDLVTGKTLGPGDGTVSAGSVQRYREDSIKELPTDATRSKQDSAKE